MWHVADSSDFPFHAFVYTEFILHLMASCSFNFGTESGFNNSDSCVRACVCVCVRELICLFESSLPCSQEHAGNSKLMLVWSDR